MLCDCCVRNARLQRGRGRALGAAIWIGSGEIRGLFGADANFLSLSLKNDKLVLAESPADGEVEVESWNVKDGGEDFSPSPPKDGSISKEARSCSSGKIAVQRNGGKLLGAAVWIPAPMLNKVLNTQFEGAENLTIAAERHDDRLVLQPKIKEVTG